MRRGRIGLMFIVCGFAFLYHGSSSMIRVPSEKEEGEILQMQRLTNKR